MAEIIGVRFKPNEKIYYFNPKGQKIAKNSYCVVETAHGLDCGMVVVENKTTDDESILKSIKPIVRVATNKDMAKLKENKEKKIRALEICKQKIKKHKLHMKLIDVEYTFDGSKILFFFTSDTRVDFRDLVKELASIFKARIELRQIGVRDEAKIIGGVGICGKPFCCHSFLDDFIPVSIKMAKEQNLSLNPTKISGICGRLMCCLKYEQDSYESLLKITPSVGSYVQTNEGKGVVIESNLITGMLKVKLDKKTDTGPLVVMREQVKVIKTEKNREHNSEFKKFKNLE